MNTPYSPDPLDETIDELLASRPLQPSAEFTERVLAETEKLASEKARPGALYSWLRLALPMAALLIAAFVIFQRVSDEPTNSNPTQLSTIELQEIFVLEEGLIGLADLEDEYLDGFDLLDELIFLDSNTQS